MKNRIAGALAALTLLGASLPAFAQTKQQKARQADKNLMRNLGVGLGAVAVDKALKGNTKDALIAGAAAAYAGKKYEDARKKQAQESRMTRKWVYRHGKRIGYYRMKHGHQGKFVRV